MHTRVRALKLDQGLGRWHHLTMLFEAAADPALRAVAVREVESWLVKVTHSGYRLSPPAEPQRLLRGLSALEPDLQQRVFRVIDGAL